MKLADALAQWDGKTTAILQAVYSRFAATAGFRDALLTLSHDKKLQAGVTWLLKYDLEQGRKLSEQQCERFAMLAPDLCDWKSRLHWLQGFPLLRCSLTPSQQSTLNVVIHQWLSADNKFVRAWAYNALFELADRFPVWREAVRELFALARQERSAAVKARLRNIRKLARAQWLNE